MITQITMGEWEDWAIAQGIASWGAGDKYYFNSDKVKCYVIYSGDLNFFFRKDNQVLYKVLTEDAWDAQIALDNEIIARET